MSVLYFRSSAFAYSALTREYAIDPLEILFAREVMRTNIGALPADATLYTLKGNHPDQDLLKAGALNLEAERRRERIMRVEIAFPFRLRRARETP